MFTILNLSNLLKCRHEHILSISYENQSFHLALQLLSQLYNKAIIPEEVYRELTDIDFPVPGSSEVETAPWLEVRQVLNLLLTLCVRPDSPPPIEKLSMYIHQIRYVYSIIVYI